MCSKKVSRMTQVFAWVTGRLELILDKLEELRTKGYENQESIALMSLLNLRGLLDVQVEMASN